MANKVKYGLSNCYFSKVSVSTTGTVSYATPVAMKGAVSLSLDPTGDQSNFAADNIANYWSGAGASGFNGTLEMALVNDAFKTAVLGYSTDANGVLYLDNNASTSPFALLFQFNGDDKNVRHVLYNCTAGRVPLNSQTTGDTIEPQTDSISITAGAALDTGLVHASLADDSTANYTGWFNSVYAVTTS